jgi:Sigma-70, region 4
MIGEVSSSTAGNAFVDSLIEPVNLGPEPLTVVAEAGENDLLGINSSGEDFERPDFWLYRDRTTSLLWRYTRLAVELGRLPSLLGREFFRARVSRYNAQTFEDSVIFVHDVESCLESLDPVDKIVIAMLALEQYTQEEAARYLHCTQRTIGRHYGEALDRLSEIFLNREILRALPSETLVQQEACQEAKTSDSGASYSADKRNIGINIQG